MVCEIFAVAIFLNLSLIVCECHIVHNISRTFCPCPISLMMEKEKEEKELEYEGEEEVEEEVVAVISQE